MSAWLDIVGIGEEGWDGLLPATRTRLESADIIIGGPRHHALAPHLKGERMNWPSPFRALVDEIRTLKGRRVAVLVTGDPLWYSAGARFARAFQSDEILFHPQVSAFQLAATRMRWSLADVETLTVHGRPAEQTVPYFYPGARMLVLTQDASTPAAVSKLLTENGYGGSHISVLGSLGGADETRINGLASTWHAEAPDFHTLAIECVGDAGLRPMPLTGLPDDAFEHDGKMTKREIRSMTLAALAPRRGAVLWDIGVGCGSVAIEWMRAAKDAQAYGLEPNPARRAFAATNAIRLGVPKLKLIDASAPEGLAGLPRPDAVFIGGGLTRESVAAALDALSPFGRLVANAVTLESESLLSALHPEYGGSLSRVSVARAGPVGSLRGWRSMMPVTQWVVSK